MDVVATLKQILEVHKQSGNSLNEPFMKTNIFIFLFYSSCWSQWFKFPFFSLNPRYIFIIRMSKGSFEAPRSAVTPTNYFE